VAIADDFSIALTGDVRHISGTTQYTVLELHRFLQDNADNASAASADDLINITSLDPSSRATDQIVTLLGTYNIDDTAAQFLYAGSIRQGSGITEVLYSGLQVVGAVNIATTEIEVVQNNAIITNYWGAGNNASGSTLNRILVKSRDVGRDIDARQIRVHAREYVDATTSTDTYAEFSVTLGEGEAVAAIFTQNDLNNDTVHAHQASKHWTSVLLLVQRTITASGRSPAPVPCPPLKLSSRCTNTRRPSRPVIRPRRFMAWTVSCSAASPTQSRSLATQVHGLKTNTSFGVPPWPTTVVLVTRSPSVRRLCSTPELTSAPCSWVVRAQPAKWSSHWSVVDGTTRLVDTTALGGTAALLAVDDGGATGDFYVQLLTGFAPVNTLPIHGLTSTSECIASAPTTRTLTPAFIGTFTGTSVIGSYGIGFDPTDTTSSDLFFPLDTDASGVSPPNNVTFTINGLVSGDRLMVGPDSAGAFDIAQMTTNATYTGATTTITVTAMPQHTPQTGNVRVITDAGTHVLFDYTSHTGVVFTGPSHDFTGDTATTGNGAYLTYIDLVASGVSENFSTIFSGSNLTLRARVREGSTPGSEIKEATGTGNLTTTGGSINVNRIADT